jgi:cell division protein FtsB
VASSRAKLTGRAAVLLLVMAVLAVSYASSMRAWLKQRSDINTLTAQIASQKADVSELAQMKKRLHDPAYIKTQAQLRFGWLMPGETGYRVIGSDGKILSGGASRLSDPTPVQPKNDPEWWQNAWGTVVEAGKTPAEIKAEEQKPQRTPVDKIGRGHSPGRKHDR